jgi:hypothetical protein
MEHLTYNPSPRAFRVEVRAATKDPLDVSDWTIYDRQHGDCPPIHPGVLWLGHDHAASSYYQSAQYEPEPVLTIFNDFYGQDWKIEDTLDTQDVRGAHPSLKENEASTARLTAAFIQSWLYFGLLESVCGRPIPVSCMVRKGSDGRDRLYSRILPVLLEVWTKSLQVIEADFREEALCQARECAIVANSILGGILDRSKDGRDAMFSDSRSLILTIEPALSSLFEAIAGVIDVELQKEISSRSVPSIFPRTYSDNLIRKGWCRFVVASAEIAISPSFLRFIDVSEFKSTSTGHQHCTADHCERNLIDTETYTQKHCTNSCHCRLVKPALATVLEILDAGYIPVVRFSANTRSLELAGIHPTDKNAGYIAFSHVWADGLGSNTETGLPACQLHRFHKLADSRLQNGAWFWIDGLCVPKQEPYRGKAIQLMRLTYQNAVGVIVLDEGLAKLSLKSSELEIGWSIFASGWFGRLWTYQEGFLPPWVDIELGDGLADLDTVIQKIDNVYHDCKANPFPAVFVRGLIAVLEKARPLDNRHHESLISRRTVDLFGAMTRRRTSRPDDQLLVLGLLLDVDIQPLMDLRGEDRWQAFYLRLGRIPWTVVFDQRYKLQISPFNWAPSTWISSGKDEWLRYDEELAEITEKGLEITLTVLVLEKPIAVSFAPLVIQQEENHYGLRLPRQTPQSAETSLQEFNTIFVRYFVEDSPQNVLLKNSSLFMRVGLGLRGEGELSTASRLQYDFTGVLEILLLTGEDGVEARKGKIIKGSWEEVRCCFT